MAALVATPSGDRLVRESRRQGIRPRRTASDDIKNHEDLKFRIKALAGTWEAYSTGSQLRRRIWRNVRSVTQTTPDRALKTPILVLPIAVQSPPTNEDSVKDLPPDYTTTDELATLCVAKTARDAPTRTVEAEKASNGHAWTELEGIRSHANKKAKKAAKEAQAAKWADSDGEEKKEEGADGADGSGGGDGGDGAGGDGGADPPGGGAGGGDEGDDWFAGGSKKDKKCVE